MPSKIVPFLEKIIYCNGPRFTNCLGFPPGLHLLTLMLNGGFQKVPIHIAAAVQKNVIVKTCISPESLWLDFLIP